MTRLVPLLALLSVLARATAQCPQVEVVLKDRQVVRGKPLSLTVTAKNTAAQPLSGLAISVQYPPGVKYLTASLRGAKVKRATFEPSMAGNGVVQWNMPTLPGYPKKGAKATLSFYVPSCFYPATMEMQVSTYVVSNAGANITCVQTVPIKRVGPKAVQTEGLGGDAASSQQPTILSMVRCTLLPLHCRSR